MTITTFKTKNELQIFTNEAFGELQVLVIDGKNYFPGTESAMMLGYKRPENAIAKHCTKDGSLFWGVIDSLGRTQEKKFISEGNLYRLILKSKLPTAEKFERWILDEVLPTIHKTGGYIANGDMFIETYLPFADESTKQLFSSTLETVHQQSLIIQEQQKTLTLQSPKIEAYDSFLNSDNTMTITEVGKIVGLSGIKLYEFLRDQGVLLKMPYNAPAQIYLNKGYFKVIIKRHDSGCPINVRQTRVTASGVEFIYTLLKRCGWNG